MKTSALHAASAIGSLLSLFVLGAGCMVAPEETTEVSEAPGSTEEQLVTPLCLGGSGAYCGNDEMSGANANTLYQCPGANLPPSSSKVCANGCFIAPAGQADYCKAGGGPICLGASAGAYCGNDEMSGANANTLYQCPGKNLAPTSSKACANGCFIAPAGQADYCKGVAGSKYKLPWHAGTTMLLTQDCNDSCCGDHIGVDKYAYDFARPNVATFDVVAARGGTIKHLKINSVSGCATQSCVNKTNYIVVDHGDGTQATYLHLKGNSLGAGISCGAVVTQGQKLAQAGTTGWSEAIHLHFEVSKTHVGAPVCECGAAGTGCGAGTVAWANFWPNATYPTLAMSFVEWPAAASCADRGITMPASQN